MILNLFKSSKSAIHGDYTTSTQEKTIDDEDLRAFLSYSQQSGLPSPENWPDDVFTIVTPSQRAKEIKYDLPNNSTYPEFIKSLPMNGEIINFNGPHFEGKLVSRMRDVPLHLQNDTNMTNAKYFSNRSRQYQWTVQGRFKRRIRYDKVMTGQEFGRPLRNMPSSKMVKGGLDMLKHKLPETFECDLFSEEPKFEHPLLAGCQSFRIDRPEDIRDENSIHGVGEDGNVIEDISILNDLTVPEDSVARRKYFSKISNLEKFHFETDFIYTFDFYANFFSPARHRLELTPFLSVDLIPYFNGYPLFMSMAKDRSSGSYLWATELWHKRLLNYHEKPSGFSRFFSGGRSPSDLDDISTAITANEPIDEKSDLIS